MTSTTPHTEESPRFVWTTLAIYVAFVSIVSAFHEPWKDETQTWRLAIDSHGIRALAHNARYEGHPLLFHVMVQALGHLSRSWWAMAALSVIIASLAAWLVLRYAPFTRLQKVLLVFGYWMAYEYAVVVRPYGLGLMFAFAACIAWTAERRRTGWAALFLVLLANTTPIGLLLAMTLALGFVVDWVWPDAGPRPTRRAMVTGGFAALVVTVVVLYATAMQMKPPADAAYKGEPRAAAGVSKWDLGALPTTELRALVPVVRATNEGVRWNHWLLLPESKAALAALLLASLAAIALGCILASRRRVALLVFFVGTVGYLLFFGLIFPGQAHHHGYLFAVWVLGAWLAWGGVPSRWPPALQRLSDYFEPDRSRILTLSLVLPVLATIEVAMGDVVGPFADARHVAEVIRSHGLQDAPVVVLGRSEGQAIAAFLDRPVLYPLEGKTRTYVVWGAGSSPYRRMVQATDSAVTQLLTRDCFVVVVSSPGKDISSALAARSKALYTTPQMPMSDDRYRVWVATAPPSARCPAAWVPLRAVRPRQRVFTLPPSSVSWGRTELLRSSHLLFL